MRKRIRSGQRKLSLAVLLLGGVFFGGGTLLEAAGTVESFTLDPLLITAQRLAKSDLNTPATTSVITGEKLKETGATNVFDALGQVPGVQNNSYGYGGEDYGAMIGRVNIRGLDRATLVLINGSPVNLMNYSSMLNVIPIEAVDRIEIVKGSNAVLYGAEAMGGVINIITKTTAGTGGSVTGKYGNYLKGGSLEVHSEGLSVVYKKELRDELDPASRIFNSTANHTGKGKMNNEAVFLNYKINNNLNFNYAYSDTENNYKTLTPAGVVTRNTNYYRTLQNANLIYEGKENFKSTLAYNKYKLRSRGYSSSVVDADSIFLDNQKVWQFGADKNDTLVGGFSVARESYAKNFGSTFDRDTWALYGSYTDNITDKFSATLGLRGHFVKGNDYDSDHKIFLPQLQSLYKVSEHSSFYTNVGKSFEMPSTTSPFTYSSVSTVIKLDPQEGWNYEAGWKQVIDDESLKIAVFHMRIKNKFKWVTENQVIPDGDSTKYLQINSDKFKNTGLEVEYSKKLDENWQLNLGAAISDPKSQEKGKAWLQDSAKLQLTAGTTYKKDKITADLELLYLGKRELAYYNMLGTSAYTDHRIPAKIDLSLTLRYDVTAHDIVEVGAYNILDRDNPVNATEYRSLPFNYVVSYTRMF